MGFPPLFQSHVPETASVNSPAWILPDVRLIVTRTNTPHAVELSSIPWASPEFSSSSFFSPPSPEEWDILSSLSPRSRSSVSL